MNQKQTNTLNMLKSVLKYLDTYSYQWSNIAPIAEKQAELKSTITELNEKTLDQQGKNPQGYTQAKNAAMNVMIRIAYKMALRVKAYARKADNLVLLQTVDVSESSLEKGTDTEVLNRCRLILAAAAGNLGSLATFKITQTELNNLQQAIDNALPKTAERDVVYGERSGITAVLPQLFKKATKEITEMDDLVEGMIDDDQEAFISGYFTVRRTNNRRGGKNRKEEVKKDEQQVNTGERA